jgi:hypothetical protein
MISTALYMSELRHIFRKTEGSHHRTNYNICLSFTSLPPWVSGPDIINQEAYGNYEYRQWQCASINPIHQKDSPRIGLHPKSVQRVELTYNYDIINNTPTRLIIFMPNYSSDLTLRQGPPLTCLPLNPHRNFFKACHCRFEVFDDVVGQNIGVR